MSEAGDRRPKDNPRSVAIVGNAPEMADQAKAIDRADWVLRFNNAAGFRAHAGRRVTHLALVNHGGQMREWLADPGFIERPVMREAGHFLFPFARKVEKDTDEDGRDWTEEAIRRLRSLGVGITVLPAKTQAAARAALGDARHPAPAPSTGFLVTLHLLSQLSPDVAVSVHGFGFAGWEGHDWVGERRWFEAEERAGRLRIHPLQERLT